VAVYLIGFAVSLAIIAFSEKKKLPLFLGCSAIAILIPCLIAGLRAQEIGTDVMVYVKPLTQSAVISDNLTEYFGCYWFLEWRNLYAADYELGFSLLIYLVAKITHSLGVVLFVIEACIVVPVFYVCARNRKQAPLWLGMAIFYLMFYNSTLNMMRQWIAMSMLLLSMQMLLERKWPGAAIFAVIACFFHTTAVVAVPVYCVYWFVRVPRRCEIKEGGIRMSASTVFALLIFAVGVLAVLNLGLMAKVLSAVGLGGFSNYISGESSGLMLNQIVLRLPFAAIYFLCRYDGKNRDDEMPFFAAMLLLDMVSAQLAGVDANAIRISYYFSVYSVMWVPRLLGGTANKAKRTVLTVMLIAFMLVYWYYSNVMMLRNETYPYAFAD